MFGGKNKVTTLEYGLLTLDRLYYIGKPVTLVNGNDSIVVELERGDNTPLKRLEFLDGRYLDLASDVELDLDDCEALYPTPHKLELFNSRELHQPEECFYFKTDAHHITLNGISCPVERRVG